MSDGNPKQSDEARQNETETEKLKLVKRTIKDERDIIIANLEKDQIENRSHESVPESELFEASENPENPSVYTENADSTAYGAETKGSTELDVEKDSRFAREHEPIDEKKAKKGLGLKDVKSGS
jgi:hypothetical protein